MPSIESDTTDGQPSSTVDQGAASVGSDAAMLSVQCLSVHSPAHSCKQDSEEAAQDPCKQVSLPSELPRELHAKTSCQTMLSAIHGLLNATSSQGNR